MEKKYESLLSIYETQRGIEKLRDYFQNSLAYELNLVRVTAPLFVFEETGLNDNLSGTEEAVNFSINSKKVEIVHSLAKWKRFALKKYNFDMHSGLYTNMNAIRKDEELDAVHSCYVDQWDWEYIIKENERTDEMLEVIVKKIYRAIKNTEIFISQEFRNIPIVLPYNIYFITAQELVNKYPDLTPFERENAICKEHKAVFIKQIGKILEDGTKHDNRSPDYDDWELNGDLLVWYEEIGRSLELSSMGIRVIKDSLLYQLKIANAEDRLKKDYHQLVVNNELPYTIGGGIGQSRLCMFLLKKKHIGEVHVSVWTDNVLKDCEIKNIKLL